MTHTKKQKRSNEFVYELAYVPEYEETEDITQIGDGAGQMGEANVDSTVNLVANSNGANATDPGEQEEETEVTATPTIPTPTTQQKIPVQAEPTLIVDDKEPIESVREVNNHLSRPDEAEGIGGSSVEEIIAHDWRLGQAHCKVQWSSGDTSWEHLKDM